MGWWSVRRSDEALCLPVICRGPEDFREKVLTVGFGSAWSQEARRQPPSEKHQTRKTDDHRNHHRQQGRTQGSLFHLQGLSCRL